jgi:hypothetical protein
MGNVPFKSVTIESAPSDWRRQFHCGWVHAQNGQAWSNDYDRMNKSEQIAYEQGRLLAREAIAAGFALPVWRGDKGAARSVDVLWTEVWRKLGHAPVPRERTTAP